MTSTHDVPPDAPGHRGGVAGGADAAGGWRALLGVTQIEAAARRLQPIGVQSPLQRNDRLSQRYGAEVFLKREDLQDVRSYKIRGAYNFVASLPSERLRHGVVCASAGNHAQGVAWTCRAMGVRGVVFLPRRTPRQKVERIRAFGGPLVDVRFAGETFDDAAAAADAEAQRTGATVVPAFDHPATAAGQGTIAREIVDELGRSPDVAVVPIGGGGLVSGMAAYFDGIGAPTRVVGVQPAGAPAMVRSVQAGHPVTIDIADDFVDGAVVRTPGRLAVAVTAEVVDRLLVVSEGRVCTELLELYQEDGIIAEPAGALAVTGLTELGTTLRDQTVVCVLSGGNNDVARYAEILERSLIDQGLKHYFIVNFPQQPGALRRFLDYCLRPTDDITLFEYIKKSSREFGPALVGVELAEASDLVPLRRRFAASGLQVEPVSPDSGIFRFLI